MISHKQDTYQADKKYTYYHDLNSVNKSEKS